MGSALKNQGTSDLRHLIDAVLESLISGEPLPRGKVARRAWRSRWGKRTYTDRISTANLTRLTRGRRQYLQCLFRHARDAVREIAKTDPGKTRLLRERLAAGRRRMHSYLAAVALAIEASLDLLWLEKHARGSNRSLRLALCYSAFGDIAEIVRTHAQDFDDLFHNVCADMHIFAVAGMDMSATVPPKMNSVRIHFRQIRLQELVALPGIKAPGLMAACADAVDLDMDLVVTIDGDGRLPLFEIVPAIVALLKSETTDAVLGSRRIPGALVSKPGLRHLTSMANACYVDVLMRPMLGHVHDPQAIFKAYRRDRLAHALKRLGYDRTSGWVAINDLQDGSLACELALLTNLSDDSQPPRLVEVPAIETMAYPANPDRMPILTGGHVAAMIAAAKRPRLFARELPLLGEGTESLAIRQPHGEVLKMPRWPERPAVRGPFQTSEVTDNRLLRFALSFRGVIKTLVCGSAGRSHSDRGFGINPAATDLLADQRPTVKECLPVGTDWAYLDHALRLPFGLAVIVKASWVIDRWLWASGKVLEWIGMLPLILVRMIGASVRLVRFFARLLRLSIRPMKTMALRVASWLLHVWDMVVSAIRKCARRVITILEVVGALRIFAAIDLLDQRSRLFHSCLRGILRVLVECRWLFESFNISVHFGRPLLCIVQQQPIRPFWSVLAAIPASMTAEIQHLLDKAVAVYRALGEAGYYDGELSLDNLGFVIDRNGAHAVLVDYGALLNARRCSPALLGQWLRGVREDFERSYQVYKLRCHLKGNNDAERMAETYVAQCSEVIDEWIQHTAIQD